MFTCKITKELEASDLRAPLSDFFTPADNFHSIELNIPIKLQDLGIKIIEQEDIHFYTNDLRIALDEITNGLFTSLYGESEIVGCIYYSRISTFVDMRFEVYTPSNEDKAIYLEDLVLPSDDAEFLYDLLDAFSKEKNIELPYPRSTMLERLKYDLHSAFVNDVLPAVFRSNYKTIEAVYKKCENEICSYVMERVDCKNCEFIPDKLIAEAFWAAISKNIINETESTFREE